MPRYALIKDTVVDNVILYDGTSDYDTTGYTGFIQLPDDVACAPGYLYDGTIDDVSLRFTAPPPRVAPLIARLEAIYMDQPMSLQLAFSGPMALVEKYLERGQRDNALEAIQAIQIPAEVASVAGPIRDAMLAEFSVVE